MADSKLKELRCEEDRRCLAITNSQVILKEWNPEDDSQGETSLSVSVPGEDARQPRMAAVQPKTHLQFEYVFAIGGDGTLLRLLRILFLRFLPETLPKIITVSMGSLGYLCNFKVKDLEKVINKTVLATKQVA